MKSRFLAIALVAAGCMTAAAGGSYLAVRHNVQPTPASPTAVETPAPAVDESEGIVAPAEKPEPVQPDPAVEPAPVQPTPRVRPSAPAAQPRPRPANPVRRPDEVRAAVDRTAVETAASPVAPAAPPAMDIPSPVERTTVSDPLPPALPTIEVEEVLYEEIYIPASSVIGLELQTSLTSDRARLEDRVDARVTRDVFANGRLAIPSGSRVTGTVTMVERGGKVKERARLGVRFHTLVLADGRQVSLRTETIYREGESPANDSSKKIGGAAIGGAVLGAIIGGKKGAIAGATAGAAGGTAMVMAGDRQHATLPAGSIVTVKLAEPVSFEVER